MSTKKHRNPDLSGKKLSASIPAANRAARRAKPRVRPAGFKHRLQARLSADGEIGYGVDPARWDDCFRAAIATTTQIPVEQVPDLRLADRLAAGDDPDEINGESWQRIAIWANRRGLQLMRHETVPVDHARWIGVCVTPWLVMPMLARIYQEQPRAFTDHCLVMSYDAVHFDPTVSVKAPRGARVRTWKPSDVTYGLTFDPIDPREKE